MRETGIPVEIALRLIFQALPDGPDDRFVPGDRKRDHDLIILYRYDLQP